MRDTYKCGAVRAFSHSLVIKLVSGIATHSHKSVWSWSAMCSHSLWMDMSSVRGKMVPGKKIPGKLVPEKMVPGENGPRKISLPKIGVRKISPRKNVLRKLFSAKRMLDLNDFLFLSIDSTNHKKMFDIHLAILIAWVLGFHKLITSEHPTHTPRCSTLTQRFFVSEFSGTIFPGTYFAGTIYPGTNFPGYFFPGNHFSGDHFSRGPFFRDSCHRSWINYNIANIKLFFIIIFLFSF